MAKYILGFIYFVEILGFFAHIIKEDTSKDFALTLLYLIAFLILLGMPFVFCIKSHSYYPLLFSVVVITLSLAGGLIFYLVLKIKNY